MSDSSDPAAPSASAPKADRYASFCGIDCAGNAQRLIERIEQHTLDRDDVGPFWPYFHQRRRATSGVRCDDLLLLASFVNPIRELFEALDDAEGLTLLEQLEEECF